MCWLLAGPWANNGLENLMVWGMIAVVLVFASFFVSDAITITLDRIRRDAKARKEMRP